ncbi:MAG TPA: HAMP domain-containing sensor histidine kinase [Clostridia bacterium]|nr:HAMP domain-containing sensor histidine kinase [Clostridia bacterium]
MFSKLRRNILLVNASIITILLIASFVAIYIVTRGDVYREIDLDFRRISFTWEDVISKIEEEGSELSIESFNIYLGKTENYDFLESRLANSYNLVIDADRNLIKAIGFYDIDYRIFTDITDNLVWEPDIIQYTSYNEIQWAYRIRESETGYTVRLMNITKRLGVLTSLIFTSLVIFIFTMVFVVLISIYITNKSVRHLEEAFRKQKQFIADASHELRTPLASISANTDLILSKNYIRPAERKWLEYIKTETMRMSGLTRDLLFLAELDEKPLSGMLFQDVNLSFLTETYALGMEAMIYEKRLELERNIQEDVHIKGDSEKLSQVLVILFENAMAYTPEGGRIVITLSKTRTSAELIIANTGIYIPEDQQTRIFDRFYKLDKSRADGSGSHGLGLSIAKSIVERHGGTISCRSVRDGLTEFIVKINIA